MGFYDPSGSRGVAMHGVDIFTPLLPEVYANPMSFFYSGRYTRSDFPISKTRRMRRICCYRLASKSRTDL